MKNKGNGLIKAVAFATIAFLMIFAVGAYASGWQSDSKSLQDNAEDGKQTVEDDENTGDSKASEKQTEEPVIEEPVFFDPFTHKVSNEKNDSAVFAGVCIKSTAPIYGVSEAGIVAESIANNAETVLLPYFSDVAKVGKLGALASRSPLCPILEGSFGVPSVYYDPKAQSSGDASVNIYDGEEPTAKPTYVSGQKIAGQEALRENGISVTLPFGFSEEDTATEDLLAADLISLPYLDDYTVSFRYRSGCKDYIYMQNGVAKTDFYSLSALSFAHVIVLFADCETVETSRSVKVNYSMENGGTGLIFTEGKVLPITYGFDADGIMRFFDENGLVRLCEGTSYLGVMKSSAENTLFYR